MIMAVVETADMHKTMMMMTTTTTMMMIMMIMARTVF